MDEAELHRYWQDIVKEAKSLDEGKTNETPLAVIDKLKSAKIYSDLIHSGKFTQEIIDLEFSYRPAVEDMFKTRIVTVIDSDYHMIHLR